MAGQVGVLHGARSYILQNSDGQIRETHSISAGLDYPGVGPEHSYIKDSGRGIYVAVDDKEALEGFQLLCSTEGIIPALESAHALAKELNRRDRYSEVIEKLYNETITIKGKAITC